MITGLSKAVTLYLAPVLFLTALLLSLFAFLAPVVLLDDRVALFTVSPSTALINGSVNSNSVDGPTVFLGALGSCSRPSDASGTVCVVASFSPTYNLSVLPLSAPTSDLSTPPSGSQAFIAISLFFSLTFFFTFVMTSFRHKLSEKVSAMLDKPNFHRFSAWIGFFGFFIGLTVFLILRLLMGKSVEDFNDGIISLGSNAPELEASIGNGFTMIWVAYAFHAVPVVSAMSKLHVTATKA